MSSNNTEGKISIQEFQALVKGLVVEAIKETYWDGGAKAFYGKGRSGKPETTWDFSDPRPSTGPDAELRATWGAADREKERERALSGIRGEAEAAERRKQQALQAKIDAEADAKEQARWAEIRRGEKWRENHPVRSFFQATPPSEFKAESNQPIISGRNDNK